MQTDEYWGLSIEPLNDDQMTRFLKRMCLDNNMFKLKDINAPSLDRHALAIARRLIRVGSMESKIVADLIRWTVMLEEPPALIYNTMLIVGNIARRQRIQAHNEILSAVSGLQARANADPNPSRIRRLSTPSEIESATAVVMFTVRMGRVKSLVDMTTVPYVDDSGHIKEQVARTLVIIDPRIDALLRSNPERCNLICRFFKQRDSSAVEELTDFIAHGRSNVLLSGVL